MKVHTLKLDTKYFDAVEKNVKRHETRKNDRDFQVGDCLHLCEWGVQGITGRCLLRYVTYISRPSEHTPVSNDFVVMSIAPEAP